VIKVAQSLERRLIPAHLHLQEPNPFVPWDRLNIAIPTTARRWNGDAPRYAGVSSFGFSGTNAHAVIQDAPPEFREPTP
jgi:phthiocerol/phenolphthiocerol synthesis type-I polyketide synthase D